ncbi:MAG: undecaprenyl diphosphate synthase family protein, partial [Anaerolineales bacterium]|nr:undecaprenyl diphosphate synthase family protein [Anaerolineales bacterium]
FTASLTAKARKRLEDAVALTAGNSGGVFNLAYNYGGRAEIIHAVRQLLAEAGKDSLAVEDVADHLFTVGLPEVDLVMRTGGDMRLSNFMLWQSAYAVLYVTQNYWPAITKNDIEAGINYYNQVMAAVS